MKRLFALLFMFIIASTSTALAAKARSISNDADSSFHAKHLALHIGESSCHATGNYIKTRSQSNRDKVIGHLEQADVFELLEVRKGYALVQVTFSHKTSPDSWDGMTGWVDSDYIDCACSSSEYYHPQDKNNYPNQPTKVPQITPPLSVITPTPTPDSSVSYGNIVIEEDPLLSSPYSKTFYVKIPCEGGYFSFRIPKYASNLHLSDNQLTFSVLTDWLQINYCYEIVSGINSAPQAELKIKSITDTLPYSLSSDYSGLHVLQDLRDHLYPSQYDYYANSIDIRNVWYDGVTSTGAAYFYESCDYTNQDDIVFDNMISESYNYGGGIAVHETVEVVYLDFKDYYNSLKTRIEQNNANNEFDSVLYNCNVSMKYTQKDDYFEATHTCASAMYGFSMCLLKNVQVFTN